MQVHTPLFTQLLSSDNSRRREGSMPKGEGGPGMEVEGGGRPRRGNVCF